MNVFEFGQLSFNMPYSEMNIIFSIASKEEYESLLDFVYDAVRKSWCYCETDEFIQEQLKQIHIKPATEKGRKSSSTPCGEQAMCSAKAECQGARIGCALREI